MFSRCRYGCCTRGIHGIRWLAVALSLSVPFVPCHVESAAAQEAPLEYQIKAAFLLNFVRYVEWPSSAFEAAGTPLVLCVPEQNPFGNALDRTVAGEIA